MDRDIPNFNPIVVSRMQQKQLQLHQQRLQHIKSFNQSRVAVSANPHNRHNKKALQLEEDKKTEIERDNLILFNKMLKIMKRRDPCNRAVSTANRVNARTSVQLHRIQEQNRTMYQRIQKQKPTIDNRKLYEQRKKQENILKFLGKYSAHSMHNAQTQSMRYEHPKETAVSAQRRMVKPDHYLYRLQNEEMAMEKPMRYEQIELEEELDEEQFNAQTRGHNNRSKKSYSSHYTTNHLNHKQDTTGKYDSHHSTTQSRVPQSAKDIILFKTKRDINGEQYEVRIVRSHLAYEIRAAAVGEDVQDPLKLVLSQSAGNQLLQQNDYDYRRIVEKIGLNGNQLALLQGDSTEQVEHSEVQQELCAAEEYRYGQAKSKEIYFNPSHISEQNEEDSYRPADSIGYSPHKNNQRLDSLGPAEEENVCIEHAEENETQQAQQAGNAPTNEICYTGQAQAYEQPQQSQQNYRAQREWRQEGHATQLQYQQKGALDLQGNYEQALDQYIL